MSAVSFPTPPPNGPVAYGGGGGGGGLTRCLTLKANGDNITQVIDGVYHQVPDPVYWKKKPLSLLPFFSWTLFILLEVENYVLFQSDSIELDSKKYCWCHTRRLCTFNIYTLFQGSWSRKTRVTLFKSQQNPKKHTLFCCTYPFRPKKELPRG